MLSYTGPVYAEIGIEQNETNRVADDIEHYAQNTNEVEVGELPNGKIKIFVDRYSSQILMMNYTFQFFVTTLNVDRKASVSIVSLTSA